MEGPRVVARDVWEGYAAKSRRGWRRRDDIRWALKGVDFRVDPGEALGVLGPNGSGKSTLLQCVAGVLLPSKGTVETHGRVSSLVDLGAGFNRELTGRENVMIAGVLVGLTRDEMHEAYPRVVDFSGLDPEIMAMPIRTYSAGMTLRIAFSLAVECDPMILLIDEVLAVGDEVFQRRCLDRIQQLRGEGCAVLIVSHDLDVVREHCSRALILNEGRVVFEGDSGAAVDHYLGSSHYQPEQTFSRHAIFGPSGKARPSRL